MKSSLLCAALGLLLPFSSAFAADQATCKSHIEMVKKTAQQIADGTMVAPPEAIEAAKKQLSESQKYVDQGDYCKAYQAFFVKP